MTSQADRSEATRGALVAVARELFASAGYAGTPIEEIVRRADVTRGAGGTSGTRSRRATASA